MVKKADSKLAESKAKKSKVTPLSALDSKGSKGQHPLVSKGSKPKRQLPDKKHGCIDVATGLYHEEHFLLSLEYEMARHLEAEKPLAMLLVSPVKDLGDFSLAKFFQANLRKIDLPAKLSTGELAIIMPRMSPARASKIVGKLGEGLERLGENPKVGAVVIGPNENLNVLKVISKARESYAPFKSLATDLLNLTGAFKGEATELLAEEKDSLYAGFSSMRPPEKKPIPYFDTSIHLDEKDSLYEAFSKLKGTK
ncbi:MAG: GGDEF domain-containing protein [Deltaproteobacteria bacterium]|jgi:GGDEF domain-containing protein|nr:GGDEF domain-containing protein [Deltaproteobacteria bacterium]